MCSTITVVYTCLMLFFPLYVYKLIIYHKENSGIYDGVYEILMEGVNPHNFHASMYIVYFLGRRFASGALLVVFVEYPFFQCAILLIFSTINLIYIITVKPLEDKKQNRIEYFNEFSIITCAHIYNIFLRGEGTIGFINGTGWMFMAMAAFNILGNLCIVVMDTLADTTNNCIAKYHEANRQK